MKQTVVLFFNHTINSTTIQKQTGSNVINETIQSRQHHQPVYHKTFTNDMLVFLLITATISLVCCNNASAAPQPCTDDTNILCNKAVVLDLVHGIRIIAVSNKHLTELPPGSFRNLGNFTRVDLTNNSISEIKNGVFNGLDFVTVDLAFNQISSIEGGAFDNMTELRYLRLDFNRISAWDAAWFKNNGNLHQISFKGNFIEEVPSRAFENVKWFHNYDIFLRVTTVVDLSGNKIKKWTSDAFGDESEIGRLNFAYNSIQSVPRELFSGVEYVEEIDFSYNKLECDTVFFLLNLASVDSVNMKYQNVH